MLTPLAVLDFVTAEPFRRFRLHIASGRTLEIGHPEMIKVGGNVSVEGYQHQTDPGEMRAERITVDGKTVELR